MTSSALNKDENSEENVTSETVVDKDESQENNENGAENQSEGIKSFHNKIVLIIAFLTIWI